MFQREEISSCLTKSGRFFNQKFSLCRLLPRTVLPRPGPPDVDTGPMREKLWKIINTCRCFGFLSLLLELPPKGCLNLALCPTSVTTSF